MKSASELRALFYLNPEVTFLNFGSFGATPKPVMDDYQKWQVEFEREPVQFMTARLPAELAKARTVLGEFIGSHPDDLVYVSNPTYAFNIVVRSLRLNPGDEVLTTDLEYGAMDRTWQYYANQMGYRYVRQPIPLPVKDEDSFVEAFFSGITDRTRAIFISHITSSTALILPVAKICERARVLGLITIVDGAHVPGQIDLDLASLNPDYYTGALHKWTMAPKGCSFLYARRELQHELDPILIGWGYECPWPSHSRFLDYHQHQGTRDHSPFLAFPSCLSFMREYNWSEVSARCKELVLLNARPFAELVGSDPLSPVQSNWLGQMCSVEIRTADPVLLKQTLYNRHRIEIPVMTHQERVYLRFSIQGFNSQEDLDVLFDAIRDLKREGMIRA